jgi:hypothetical protein
MASRFEQLDLDQWRLKGDREADPLVGKTLGKGVEGIRTYNRVMLLANQIIVNPGLLLAQGSVLEKEFAADTTKRELAGYFFPMPAPDWVDPKKLELASQLWRDYTIPTMGVLYAASLPYCYLIKNGIPALYDTGKLLEPYLSQRLYETGLMLSAVLDPGGLQVIEDREFDYEGVLIDELKKRDPRGQWVKQGNALVRREGRGLSLGGSAGPAAPDEIVQSVNARAGTVRRFLWGKGYVTAKKVRFLHASMRYMLLNPGVFQAPPQPAEGPKPMVQALAERREGWDMKALGYPVNQEDLAYTLLTFGLVIPRGLERWGVAVSDEQKEAFLHLWKVVGYVMGIEEVLLTDRWDEAEDLFDRIRARQAGGSPEGMRLTDALIGLLDQYLPKLPGVPENSLPVELIRSQIGDDYAKQLIDPARFQAARQIWRWPIYKALDLGAGAYFFIRGRMVKALPLWGELTTGLMHDVGEGLIAAWRDAYRRQPFFVPTNPTTWERVPGADAAYLGRLRAWRQQVLKMGALGLILLVVAVVALAAAIPLLLLAGKTAGLVALGIFGGAWVGFAKIARKRLNEMLAARPEPDERICKLGE